MLKQLDKRNDPDLEFQIKQAYQSITRQLLDDIEVYRTLTEPDRWDKIIGTYQTLNKLGEVISKSKARAFISPEYYNSAITVSKQNAAEEYYNLGMDQMRHANKSAYRDAWFLFSKANDYYPGYRDVIRQMNVAWQESVLNIIINPVTDQSSFYAGMRPNRFGNSFNSDLLQRSLVRDLGGDFRKNSPAKFFTDREAYMARIDVDWIIDIA